MAFLYSDLYHDQLLNQIWDSFHSPGFTIQTLDDSGYIVGDSRLSHSSCHIMSNMRHGCALMRTVSGNGLCMENCKESKSRTLRGQERGARYVPNPG